jgi:hypothetical protein
MDGHGTSIRPIFFNDTFKLYYFHNSYVMKELTADFLNRTTRVITCAFVGVERIHILISTYFHNHFSAFVSKKVWAY